MRLNGKKKEAKKWVQRSNEIYIISKYSIMYGVKYDSGNVKIREILYLPVSAIQVSDNKT